MKRLFLVSTFIVASICSLTAQQKQDATTDLQNSSNSQKEYLQMKKGKMVVVSGDKTMPMESAMTLKNGTMMNPDGSYQLANGGKQMKLHNNQFMDMNGIKYTSLNNLQKGKGIDPAAHDMKNMGSGNMGSQMGNQNMSGMGHH